MALVLCKPFLFVCSLFGVKEQEICRIGGEYNRSWCRLCRRTVLGFLGSKRRPNAGLSAFCSVEEKLWMVTGGQVLEERVAGFWSFTFGTAILASAANIPQCFSCFCVMCSFSLRSLTWTRPRIPIIQQWDAVSSFSQNTFWSIVCEDNYPERPRYALGKLTFHPPHRTILAITAWRWTHQILLL